MSDVEEGSSAAAAPSLGDLPSALAELLQRPEAAQGDPAFLLSVTELAMTLSAYAGPIPPPEVARQWNDLVPGAAERFLAMAEKQSDHRQDLERIAVASGHRRSWLGLWLGFVISVLFLVCSAVLIATGHDAGGDDHWLNRHRGSRRCVRGRQGRPASGASQQRTQRPAPAGRVGTGLERCR